MLLSIYYWSPGYKVLKEITDKNGKKSSEKIFVPTRTFTAAIAHMKNVYGSKELYKYKDDIHPGHVSLQTENSYLSIGVDLPSIEDIELTGEYPMIFSNSFREDVIGIRRLPESVNNFFTLDVVKIEETIDEFLKSNKLYSILGARFGFTEGESCATACLVCLSADGLERLQRVDHKFLGQRGILTSTGLAKYAKNAEGKERAIFSETAELSKEVNLMLEKEFEVIRQQIAELEKQTREANRQVPSNQR